MPHFCAASTSAASTSRWPRWRRLSRTPDSRNVRTILASGNVLLESRSGVDAVSKKAEKALRDDFGYDAWVLAYDIDTVRAISKRLPVRARGRRATIPTSRSSPTRTCSTNSPNSPKTPGPTRRSSAARASIYWQVPNKGTLDTTIGKTMGQEAIQVVDDHPQPAHHRESAAVGRFGHVSATPTAKADGTVLTGCLRDGAADAAGAGHEARRPDSHHRRPDGDPAGRRHRLRLRQVRLQPVARTWRCARWPSTSRPAATSPTTRGHRGRARRGAADQLLSPRRGRRRRSIPLAHSRFAADDRLAPQAAAASERVRDVCPVGAGLQLDGPG